MHDVIRWRRNFECDGVELATLSNHKQTPGHCRIKWQQKEIGAIIVEAEALWSKPDTHTGNGLRQGDSSGLRELELHGNQLLAGEGTCGPGWSSEIQREGKNRHNTHTTLLRWGEQGARLLPGGAEGGRHRHPCDHQPRRMTLEQPGHNGDGRLERFLPYLLAANPDRPACVQAHRHLLWGAMGHGRRTDGDLGAQLHLCD